LEKTPMPTRNVVLKKRQEKLIETLVESGRYQNASEVLRDGLRLVEQREAEDATKLEALREAARVGVAVLDRGEFKEFENIEDLQAYLNASPRRSFPERPNKSFMVERVVRLRPPLW
jgi:antitoxin ParD1/3/4